MGAGSHGRGACDAMALPQLLFSRNAAEKFSGAEKRQSLLYCSHREGWEFAQVFERDVTIFDCLVIAS